MDEDELLAIFDPGGRRVGIKPRHLVHRDGDWHWLVFVWAARLDEEGRMRLLLQLRARPGDPYAGHLDALAGGHVAALESHRQGALREFREEAGIALGDGDLVYLGARSLENPTGLCRRVIEHFYLCRRPVLLTEVAFSREANGFVEVDLEEFADLLAGDRERIAGLARWAERGGEVFPFEITGAFLAAYSEEILDSFCRSLRAICAYLETGEVDRGIWI